MKILTNAVGRKASPTWSYVTRYHPTSEDSRFSAFRSAVNLYRAAGREEYDCVVLGANRADAWYALLQAVLPFRRPLTVKIQCEWNEPANPFLRILKKLHLRLVARSLDACMVWSSGEVEAFAEAFGIPASKLHFLPYHHTLEGNAVEPSTGDYIFSGGNKGRDYDTLIEAVRDIDVPVVIATTRTNLAGLKKAPSHVSIGPLSHREYFQSLAGCAINVVPVDGGLLRSTGHQTYLNSMALGKPTIVTDPAGASDYIRHGVDGLLVPPGDASALRDAILSLLESPEDARRMGERARRVRAEYSTEAHFRRLCKFIQEEFGLSTIQPIPIQPLEAVIAGSTTAERPPS